MRMRIERNRTGVRLRETVKFSFGSVGAGFLFFQS